MIFRQAKNILSPDMVYTSSGAYVTQLHLEGEGSVQRLPIPSYKFGFTHHSLFL